MRILLTNDDGIHARGLEILKDIAKTISDDVWIVAPEADQSGVAHSLTLNHPMRVRTVDPKTFAVTGTPSDCIIMGVRELVEGPIDLVLSGVNAGQNIGDYITYSGTVAGAMEGCLLGIPSIALSQQIDYDDYRHIPWDTVKALAPDILRDLIGIELPKDTFLNVNFPNCFPDKSEGVAFVSQGKFEHGLGIGQRSDGRGLPYYWLEFLGKPPGPQSGTDIQALNENRISVTPVRMDMTDHRFLDELKLKTNG